DMVAIEAGLAAADMLHVAARAGNLAGQHPVVTLASFAQVLADDGFSRAISLAARRYRIHLGAVDEIDAGVPCPIDLGEGVALGVLFAPGHGAQAQGA